MKLVVLPAIGGLIGASRGRRRRDAATPRAVFWLIGGLTLLNAAMGLIWR